MLMLETHCYQCDLYYDSIGVNRNQLANKSLIVYFQAPSSDIKRVMLEQGRNQVVPLAGTFQGSVPADGAFEAFLPVTVSDCAVSSDAVNVPSREVEHSGSSAASSSAS
jgi:hypothetical protein